MAEEETYKAPEYLGFVCPRCGWVLPEGYAGPRKTAPCPICYHDLTPIDEKWKIRCVDYDKHYVVPFGRDPATWDRCVLTARSYFKEFFEEYVLSSPEFNRWDYEHPIENYEVRTEEFHKYLAASKKFGTLPKCPKCNSGFVYESSGLINKIRGRKWHCPRCKIDF